MRKIERAALPRPLGTAWAQGNTCNCPTCGTRCWGWYSRGSTGGRVSGAYDGCEHLSDVEMRPGIGMVIFYFPSVDLHTDADRADETCAAHGDAWARERGLSD